MFVGFFGFTRQEVSSLVLKNIGDDLIKNTVVYNSWNKPLLPKLVNESFGLMFLFHNEFFLKITPSKIAQKYIEKLRSSYYAVKS